MQNNTAIRIMQGGNEIFVRPRTKIIPGKNLNAYIERCLVCDNNHYLVIAHTESVSNAVLQALIEKFTNKLKYLPSRTTYAKESGNSGK